jgi:FkbM family methyltransferase
MMRIAFIDTLGLTYDGSTLEKRGLGGSESAVIRMSQELAKIGFDVTVFNDCTSDDSRPGLYNNVIYAPIEQIHSYQTIYDVVIVSRSVKPIVEGWLPIANAKHVCLWMHDTFCEGDDQIEYLINVGKLQEIFTLSDWHTGYVTHCDHGFRRNYDILKNHVFMTRNGINATPKEWVDVRDKDPNLFVFNASVTKGMVPLVKQIWPEVKRRIPEAKLKIIGGYYKFREAAGPDQQQKDWTELMLQHGHSIEFTGVITQQEISDILRKASYMIYPVGFPETFGISTLEALAHNVPLITCQFGALEETAIDLASWKIKYPVEKNWAMQWLNEESQVNLFVDKVVEAYHTPYLHQQKMYACNQVKDICTWDTVALQWKQHLYHKLGEYLPVDEYRKVTKINNKVRKIFNRRFLNSEEIREPQQGPFHYIYVVTPVYNAEKYIQRCIESVVSQDYDNYCMFIVDDCSTDNTREVIDEYRNSLPHDLKKKIFVTSNKDNLGAVWNQVNTISNECGDGIVMLLDGDDWLVNDPNIFHKYNNIYNEGAEFTYGSCWSVCDNIPLIAQEYPPEVKRNKAYRNYKFNWNMPYTHFRTFRSYLMHGYLHDHGNYAFRDGDGNWLKAGGDTSVFYTMIEYADPDKVVCVPEVVYNYNDANPINDYKVNSEEQTKNANRVVASSPILIAIPTARYIEADTFKSIYDLEVPEGYETTFQYFYGYRVDQVRNLIADWVVRGYDYLFSVDHDITFPPDTLKKMIQHDKDLVAGVYRQRLEPQRIEIYDLNQHRMEYSDVYDKSLVQIGGCGFGCVLVKKKVLAGVGYPQFEYHPALDHGNTISEDTDFCKKAMSRGFTLWCDPSIRCGHIGSTTMRVEVSKVDPVEARLRELSLRDDQPKDHVDYLHGMMLEGVEPKVIYDIGACVMHWTKEARKIWPDSKIIMFDGMNHAEFLYKESGLDYYCDGPLGDFTRHVKFYENPMDPAGNSVFKEDTQFFTEDNATIRKMRSLDDIVEEKGWPKPDLVKIDVQGAELLILVGAEKTLSQCDDIIIEMQHQEYNLGAPQKDVVTQYLIESGFELVSQIHVGQVDGDYHFRRRKA